MCTASCTMCCFCSEMLDFPAMIYFSSSMVIMWIEVPGGLRSFRFYWHGRFLCLTGCLCFVAIKTNRHELGKTRERCSALFDANGFHFPSFRCKIPIFTVIHAILRVIVYLQFRVNGRYYFRR